MSRQVADPAATLVRLDHLVRAADNPRTHMDGIAELAESIELCGQLVPIIVEARTDGRFDLLAGHRRVAALELLGHERARAEVRTGQPLDAIERLKLMLTENGQRRSLDPIDEANAYRRLMRDHGLTQLEVAHLVGTSDFTVSRRLELLRLNRTDQARIRAGTLTLGGAHHLLSIGKKKQAPRGRYVGLDRADDTAHEARTITIAVTDKEWAEITRRCKARNYTPEAFARAALQKALRS